MLVVALVVRLWGVAWALPWQFHPDEGHYTWKAIDLMSQDTLNPKYFRNPSLFTYLLLGEYKLLGFQPPKSDEQAASSDGYLRPPSGVAFVGRLTSAILGLLTVAAVGWIGWWALGPWTGVLGALFLGLAFIHVRDSHFATNDVPATLLLTLSVGMTLSLLDRSGACGTYVLSRPVRRARHVDQVQRRVIRRAAAGGPRHRHLAHVADCVPSVGGHGSLAPTTLAPSSPRRGEPLARPLATTMRFVLLPILLAGLVSLAAYLAGTPFTVLDFPKWLADFRTQSSFVDEGWEGQAKLRRACTTCWRSGRAWAG